MTGKNFTGLTRPRALAKHFVAQMLTRDMFPVANLLALRHNWSTRGSLLYPGVHRWRGDENQKEGWRRVQGWIWGFSL